MKFEVFDELDAGGRATGRWAIAKEGLRPANEGTRRWYQRDSSNPSYLSNSLDGRVLREGIVIGQAPSELDRPSRSKGAIPMTAGHFGQGDN
ncbi:hypothetical protein H8A97_03560 [Bradyrhizobium sp. Arg62]|uniref:hypothetical protein n=1 Tax=Bradyrhizobium brasilense TaxID=1419277 RepID=UPI001E333AD8|nr:hypothetical protein [Bradyrhizobium brasilense]MCC8944200.1 hypothetical protein [Bradyrhizobium brasilense]